MQHMKFNPSWPQIALIGLLLAAIILSNIFAPGAFGTVTSVVSVVVSFLVGSPLKPADESKNPETDK